MTYEANGNVKTQEIINKGNSGWDNLSFTYSYDNMNRLINTGANPSTYKEEFTYDDDGNFATKNSNGTNFTYNYSHYAHGSYSNRLTSINSYFNFSYDNKGNLILKENTGGTDLFTATTHDDRNLPLTVWDATHGTVNYKYDDSGNRIVKKVGTGSVTNEYYLRDHTGKEVALYDLNTDKLKMVNLYGNGMIGNVKLTWNGSTRTDERYYYVNDHLGTVRLVIDENSDVSSAKDYYAYGSILREINYGTEEKYDFTGKERDVETGLHYFGARPYDSDIGRWINVDPLAHLYPGHSPYNYTLNNPLRFIDPNGMSVYTGSDDDREMILNTLSEEERKYIQFDEDGLLNADLMSEYADGGGNFNALLALANSEDVFQVMVTSKLSISGTEYEFGNVTVDTDFDGGYASLSTSETGWIGQTITKSESNNGNIQIAINQSLSKAGRAETFAHEGYGHAYFMAIGKNPDHIRKLDQQGNRYEANIALKKQIIKSILETRKNMGN